MNRKPSWKDKAKLVPQWVACGQCGEHVPAMWTDIYCHREQGELVMDSAHGVSYCAHCQEWGLHAIAAGEGFRELLQSLGFEERGEYDWPEPQIPIPATVQ